MCKWTRLHNKMNSSVSFRPQWKNCLRCWRKCRSIKKSWARWELQSYSTFTVMRVETPTVWSGVHLTSGTHLSTKHKKSKDPSVDLHHFYTFKYFQHHSGLFITVKCKKPGTTRFHHQVREQTMLIVKSLRNPLQRWLTTSAVTVSEGDMTCLEFTKQHLKSFSLMQYKLNSLGRTPIIMPAGHQALLITGDLNCVALHRVFLVFVYRRLVSAGVQHKLLIIEHTFK